MEGRKALLVGLFSLLVVGAACNGAVQAPYTPQSANFPTDVPACQALNGFDSYRYVYTWGWFSPKLETPPDETEVGEPSFALLPSSDTFDFSQVFEGSIINPDRINMFVTTDGDAGATLRWVAGQQWTNTGANWLPVGAPQNVFFPPALVCHAAMDGLDLTGVEPSQDTVGEVETDHYRLEQVPLQTAVTLWQPQSDPGRLLTNFDVDIWLTEDGWPARLEVKSEAKYPSGRDFFAELSLEIIDVNSEDISIEPPTG